MQLPDKPVVIVLGGVSPHITVIKKIKDQGYHTVLIDYKPAPPAAAFADTHLQLSTLDRDAVLKAARDWNASAVVSVCLDQPVPVIAWVREQMGLPGPITPESAHMVTNKDAMKDALKRAGVDTADWQMLQAPEDAAGLTLRFPVVAKPVAGTGSLGVVFAHNAEQLVDMLDHSFEQARGDAVLVEEFVEGLELSVDCMVVDDTAHVLLARERHKTWFDGATENTCHASVAPADIDPAQTRLVADAATAIAREFGLHDGPMLIQGIVTADGRFVVLEVAGRLGGGPGASRVVAYKIGFDYVQASIDQQLGLPVTVTQNDDGCYYAANNIYASEGVFSEITGLDDAVAAGLIEEYYTYRTRGEVIPARVSGRSRIAAVVLKSDSRSGLGEKMRRCFDLLEVYDEEGRSIITKDIGVHKSI